MIRNGPKLQKKGTKFQNFQNFSINSKKFKNYISFEIFTHLRSELQMRIPRASSGEIRHRLFQVTSNVLLFHFHVDFFNFHGQFFTFRPVQISLFGPHGNRGFFHVQGSLYAEIKAFSVYGAGYMRKNLPNPCTYAAVLQTVAYAAAHMVF